MSAYYVVLESEYSGNKVPIPTAATFWDYDFLWLSSVKGKYNSDVRLAGHAKEDFLYDATGLCYQGSGKLESGAYISCVTKVDWTGIASQARRRAGDGIDPQMPEKVKTARQPAGTFIGFEWAQPRDLRAFRTAAICATSAFLRIGDLLYIPELEQYLRYKGGDGILRVTDTGGALCPTSDKPYETIDLFVGEGRPALDAYLDFIGRPSYPPSDPRYIPGFVTAYKR